MARGRRRCLLGGARVARWPALARLDLRHPGRRRRCAGPPPRLDYRRSRLLRLVDGAELLGSISLHRIDQEQNDGGIGYWITPAARGHGLAARAAEAACAWASTDLGLYLIQLFHAVENTASARVADKAGFTYEGRLRQSHRYGDGLRHDQLLWARLITD